MTQGEPIRWIACRGEDQASVEPGPRLRDCAGRPRRSDPYACAASRSRATAASSRRTSPAKQFSPHDFYRKCQDHRSALPARGRPERSSRFLCSPSLRGSMTYSTTGSATFLSVRGPIPAGRDPVLVLHVAGKRDLRDADLAGLESLPDFVTRCLTPSPWRSPLDSITSPRWIPMRTWKRPSPCTALDRSGSADGVRCRNRAGEHAVAVSASVGGPGATRAPRAWRRFVGLDDAQRRGLVLPHERVKPTMSENRIAASFLSVTPPPARVRIASSMK